MRPLVLTDVPSVSCSTQRKHLTLVLKRHLEPCNLQQQQQHRNRNKNKDKDNDNEINTNANTITTACLLYTSDAADE